MKETHQREVAEKNARIADEKAQKAEERAKKAAERTLTSQRRQAKTAANVEARGEVTMTLS